MKIIFVYLFIFIHVPPFNKMIQFILLSIGNLLTSSFSGLVFVSGLKFPPPENIVNGLSASVSPPPKFF